MADLCRHGRGLAGLGDMVTLEELQGRLVLFARLHVAEHAEECADEVLDRFSLMIQQSGNASTSTETLCLQSLGIARALVWEAKLRLARGESMTPSPSLGANDARRASAREALRAALLQARESQTPVDVSNVQPTRAELRDLLLHRLPELDAQRVEEQLLVDSEVAVGLRGEEGDLLDDYSADRLTDDERKDVERFLLTSATARQRVKVTRALKDVGQRRAQRSHDQPEPAKTVAPWNRWSLRAAGAIVVVMLAVAFFLTSLNDAAEPTPLPRPASAATVDTRPVSSVSTAPVVAAPDDPDSPAASAAFNVLLLADQQRAFGAYPLSLSDDAVDVRLQAEAPFADVTKRYEVRIQDEAGRPVFVAPSVQPREAGGLIIVETLIPARALGAGARKVVLRPVGATTALASWELDVQREP